MSQVDRKQAALYAIKNSADTPYWDGGVKPFLSHHLEVVDPSYWQSEVGTTHPSYSDILELILFKAYHGNDLTLDFTLPGNITTYIIRVVFNAADEISGISTVAN